MHDDLAPDEHSLPLWLTDEGFEAGDDLADFDAYQCDRCSDYGGIDDATTIEIDGDLEYLCEQCAAQVAGS